jgi:hypothetical protein
MNARQTSFHETSLVFLAMLLILAMAACSPKKPLPDQPETAPQAIINPDSLDVDTAYAEGLHAFWIGSYKAAASLFENLARRSDDHPFRSKALFGLACAKLAGAENQEEFKAARAVWQEWEQASSGTVNQADPRMITPFLQNAKIMLGSKDSRDFKFPFGKTGTSEQDLAKRLQEKEKEVMVLQKQIKALEAIHREIQEKKKLSNQ